MVMLVTLQQASEHVRRDGDDDDADLTLKIEGASEMVLNYLKYETNPRVDFLNTAGEVDMDTAGDLLGVPKAIKIATLLLVAILYRDREGQTETNARTPGANWQMGYLPPQIMAILYPLRPPEVL